MVENVVNALKPFHAMEILAAAKKLEAEGRDICHMEVGESAFTPAPGVIAAVAEALPQPQRYTHAKGLIELRQALSDYYRTLHGVEADPEHIIVTTGSSAGFILAFLSGFEPGARIAVTRPGYPAYLNLLSALGFAAVEIEVDASHGWRLSADDIEATYAQGSFDGLLFASPANPTGAVVDRAGLSAIVETCERLGVLFISDEIYHGLDYTGPSVSAAELSDNSIIINSFSKFYCMTGWRIGWMVLPEELVRKTEVLQQNMFISAPTLSQIAALAALQEREYSLDLMVGYTQNRTLLTDGLKGLGFEGMAQMPDGGFYLYVDVSKFTNDSMQFCQRLLQEAGVATTPGVDFDRVNGHHYVRFSYAGDRAVVEDALQRLAGFMRDLG